MTIWDELTQRVTGLRRPAPLPEPLAPIEEPSEPLRPLEAAGVSLMRSPEATLARSACEAKDAGGCFPDDAGRCWYCGEEVA